MSSTSTRVKPHKTLRGLGGACRNRITPVHLREFPNTIFMRTPTLHDYGAQGTLGAAPSSHKPQTRSHGTNCSTSDEEDELPELCDHKNFQAQGAD